MVKWERGRSDSSKESVKKLRVNKEGRMEGRKSGGIESMIKGGRMVRRNRRGSERKKRTMTGRKEGRKAGW